MFLYLVLFLAGLILGSFANVVIARLPIGQTPWNPVHSHCPHCSRPIQALDNVPILSFLILKGRCRSCRKKISLRYPAVELLMALGFCSVGWRLSQGDAPAPLPLLMFCAFFFTLLCVTFIDLDTYTIPDVLSLGLLLFMIAGSPFNPLMPGEGGKKLIHSALSGLAGGVLFWLMAFTGEKIFKKEAMGGGDIKLFAAIGASLGWHRLIDVVIFSSLLGLLYALPQMLLKKLKREDPIPYGPFLSAAAFLSFLWIKKGFYPIYEAF